MLVSGSLAKTCLMRFPLHISEVNGSGVVVAPTCCSGTPVNTAAIAGIVVGGAVLILCIVVVVVVLIVCVIKKKQGELGRANVPYFACMTLDFFFITGLKKKRLVITACTNTFST